MSASNSIVVTRFYSCAAPLAFCQQDGGFKHPTKAMKMLTKVINGRTYFDRYIPFSEVKDFIPEIKEAVFIKWESSLQKTFFILSPNDFKVGDKFCGRDFQHTVSSDQRVFYFQVMDVRDDIINKPLNIYGCISSGRPFSAPLIVAKSESFKIPLLTNKDSEGNSIECAICLEKVSDFDLEVTQCNHTFHGSCMDNVKDHICPLCRKDL